MENSINDNKILIIGAIKHLGKKILEIEKSVGIVDAEIQKSIREEIAEVNENLNQIDKDNIQRFNDTVSRFEGLIESREHEFSRVEKSIKEQVAKISKKYVETKKELETVLTDKTLEKSINEINNELRKAIDELAENDYITKDDLVEYVKQEIGKITVQFSLPGIANSGSGSTPTLDQVLTKGNTSSKRIILSSDSVVDYGSSQSTGGWLLIDNTNNAGAGLVLYTNNGSSATAPLAVLTSDNTAFDQHSLLVNHEGSTHAVTINNNNTSVIGSVTLNLTSANIADSTAFIEGSQSNRGTLKLTHKKPTGVADADASALSILLENDGASTAARGIFIDTESGATGDFVNLRNNGAMVMRVDSTGAISIGEPTIASRFDIKSASLNSDLQRWIASDGSRLGRVTETSSGHGWFEIDNNAGTAIFLIRGDGGDSYFNSGQFGIGITSPAAALHVVGETRIDGSLLQVQGTGAVNIMARSSATATDGGTIRVTGEAEGLTSFRGGYIKLEPVANQVHIGVHDAVDELATSDIVSIRLVRANGNVVINTPVNITNSLQADSLRIDQNPVLGTITPTHTFSLSLNGVTYRVQCAI